MSAAKDAREALAAAHRDGTGIETHARPEANFSCPCVMVFGHSGEQITMAPDYELTFDLILFVSQNQTDWEDQLDDWLTGDNSVFDALRESPFEASSWDSYGQLEWSGVNYWTVRVPVTARV